MAKMSVMERRITIMEKFRFHVVGLMHTEATKEFLPCAYSQKVMNFCKMMKSLGHEVFLYQGGDKTDAGVEFISTLPTSKQQEYFGHTDWRKDFFPIEWKGTEPYWVESNNNAIEEIKKRIQPKDFICVIGGHCHKPIADAFPANHTVEFGIGYSGTFSNFKIYESYAWMHYLYGKQGIENGNSFDCVIPNFFDPQDFPFTDIKEDYYLYIGRMVQRKGVIIAVETTKVIGKPLILAGQGVLSQENGKIVSRELTLEGSHIKHIGTVGVKERGELMSKAKAVFVPTSYIGPFEGVSIEAMMCGTPVITTDWGCFAENVVDGVTGFRTRTLGEAVWAAKNVDQLDYKEIRDYAVKNFSMDRVKYLYEAYFEQLMTLWEDGWYSLKYDPTNKRYQRL